MAETAKFIGIDSLTTIANRINTQIIMGPAYARADEMDRLKIKITAGIQFKDTQFVMNRKGGTARRKVVGEEVNSQIGYLEERPLVAVLSWGHYTDNEDNYIETPLPVTGDSTFSYPLSETAMQAVLMNYAEDLYLNLWWGSLLNDRKTDPRSLYDGFHALRNADIAKGNISNDNNNLVNITAVDLTTRANSLNAFSVFEEFYMKWSTALRGLDVIVYCSNKMSVALMASYANNYNGNFKVTQEMGADGKPTGNWFAPEYPKVTFAPSSEFGNGDKMIATVPFNFEYGVNTFDSRNHVSIKQGSDRDNKDLIIQVESVQGCRIINKNSNAYCESNGTLTAPNTQAGDFMKDFFTVTVNDETMGSVTVNGAAVDNTKQYAANTVLALVATPKSGYDFVKWSDNVETASRNVVAKGRPDAVVAIFKVHTT